MDFRKLMTSDTAIFNEDGYYVWCGTMFRYKAHYYLAYSRWKRELGFDAWVTDSEICLAKSQSMMGDFKYVKTIRTKDSLGKWDSSCAHNPTVIEHGGKYYLYYMGNSGKGEYWHNRNLQRIGVASCSDPEGEWSFNDRPLIDISDEGFDSKMVSNPTVTHFRKKDVSECFVMLYKAVSKYGEPPRYGDVVCGIAMSAYPDRDFNKLGKPIMINPENGWSVEDPFVWQNGEKLYALVKDFHGYFTKTNGSATALFESDDGIDFKVSEHSLAFERKLYLSDGTLRDVSCLERPQLYIENGVPKLLLCACAVDNDRNDVFNVRIKLRE